MIAKVSLFLIGLLVQGSALCQDEIVLEHRRNPERRKNLTLGLLYKVQAPSFYGEGFLVGRTDSALLFAFTLDTTIVIRRKKNTGADAVTVERIHRRDTAQVPIDGITKLRSLNSRRHSILQIPALVGACGLVGAAITLPVAGAVSAWGNDAVMDEWAIGIGYSVALLGTATFIKWLTEPRYDLEERWRVQAPQRTEPEGH